MVLNESGIAKRDKGAKQRSCNAGLSLQLLGGCSFELDGRALTDFAYEKLRALLIFLVLEKGKCFQREWLSEMLWPDLDEEAAKQNLRRALSNLRRVLREDKDQPRFLLTTRSTVAFAAHDQIRSDVEAFVLASESTDGAALETGLALYRGDFLAGFSLLGSQLFENWCEEKRESLRRRYAGGLARQLRKFEEQGNLAEAIHYANRLVELEIWDEAAVARLMRLHARAENVKAALLVYERCRKALDEDLGVLPGDALRELAEQLRRRDAQPITEVVREGASGILPKKSWSGVLHCHWESSAPDAAARVARAREEMESRLLAGGLRFSVPYAAGLLVHFRCDDAFASLLERAAGWVRQVAREAGVESSCVVHAGEASHVGDSPLEACGQLAGSALALRAFAAPGEMLLSAAARSLLADDFPCECLEWESPLTRHGLFPLFRLDGGERLVLGVKQSARPAARQLVLAGRGGSPAAFEGACCGA